MVNEDEPRFFEVGEHPAITAAQMGHRDPRMTLGVYTDVTATSRSHSSVRTGVVKPKSGQREPVTHD